MGFLKKMFSGVATTAETFAIRTGLKLAGAAALTWLVSKHVDPTQAQNLIGYISGALITGLGIWMSQKNTTSTLAKSAAAVSAGFELGQSHVIAQAQAQGVTVQAAADQAKVAAVGQAMQSAGAAAPATQAAIVTALKNGTF